MNQESRIKNHTVLGHSVSALVMRMFLPKKSLFLIKTPSVQVQGEVGPSNSSRGFSLLETIVAISILMMTIVGPLSLAAKGIAFADYVKDEITGFYLAQEAIELIRNVRDTNIKNDRPWIDGLEQCIESDVSGTKVCRIDVWNYNNPDGKRGVKYCPACGGNEEERKSWERLRVVSAGTGSSVKLYGHDFTPNILNGTEKDSIFSRRITIKDITVGYINNPAIPTSEHRILKLDDTGVDEVNITVEVSWTRGSNPRKVIVSENMFSI